MDASHEIEYISLSESPIAYIFLKCCLDAIYIIAEVDMIEVCTEYSILIHRGF
jgi:hypothetical protein